MSRFKYSYKILTRPTLTHHVKAEEENLPKSMSSMKIDESLLKNFIIFEESTGFQEGGGVQQLEFNLGTKSVADIKHSLTMP